MRSHKPVIYMVLFMFALMMYSPTIAYAAVSCQADISVLHSVGNDVSMKSVSDLDVSADSYSENSSQCCCNDCKGNQENSSCHNHHCHTSYCCDAYVKSGRNGYAHQHILIKYFNYEDHLIVDEIISSIFKPPQVNA